MAVIVTVDPNHPNGTIPTENRINLEYFKTPPGIVKIAQFVIGVILLCLNTPIWLTIIVYLGFIITSFWIWIYFFGLQQKYQISIPWPVLEFYYTAGAAFAYAVTSLFTFITIFYMASAIFGIINAVAYGTGAFYLLNDWKEWKGQNAAMQSPGMGPGGM